MDNEKKEGFTLVELLAVIILLSVLATIGGVAVSKVIKSSKESAYEQQVANIIKAAKEWAIEHTDKLPDTGSICVTLDTLDTTGKLTGVPNSPTNGEMMTGSVKIACTTNCVSYDYTYEKLNETGCY